MYDTAITLICNPARPQLDNELSGGFSCFLDMQDLGDVRRSILADGIANDFICFGGAGDQALVSAISKFIGNRPIDFAVQPVANRRKKLLIADMDSTIIQQECIDELAEFAGKRAEISAITERAMRGELDFEAALKERVAMLKGLPESVLAETFEKRITLTPGAQTLVKTMNARGAVTALVSGGFTYFTGRVAENTGFQINQANELFVADEKLTGAVREPILGRAAKQEALERIARENTIGLADTLAVGDGANDLSMLARSGLGVAFHAKPAVAQAAAVQINHSDLTALLYLQGIAKAEFVSE
jgi:phosphoserine phosphatase